MLFMNDGGWKKSEQPVEGENPDKSAAAELSDDTFSESLEDDALAPSEIEEIISSWEQESGPSAEGPNASNEVLLHDRDEAQEDLSHLVAVSADEAKSIDKSSYLENRAIRGKRKWAATLGLIFIILAIVGVVTVVWLSVKAVKGLSDDTPLKNEVEGFLYPVIVYAPESFDSIAGERQDQLLLGSVFAVMQEDVAWQKESNSLKSRYTSDDMGRLIVPLADVEAAYMELFGDKAKLAPRSIGEDDGPFSLRYDEKIKSFYVPVLPVTSDYVPVLGGVSRKKNVVTVEVFFISAAKVGLDSEGKAAVPDKEKADYSQEYILEMKGKKITDGFVLTSIKDKEGSSAKTQSTETTSATTADVTETTAAPTDTAETTLPAAE